MISYFRRRKKERISAGLILEAIFVVLVLAIIGFLIFSNIKISQKKTEVQKQIYSIQNQIDNFQKKDEQLKLGISKGLDQDYVEKVAREDLSLQKQGEKVVGFILPAVKGQDNSNQKFWQPGSIWQSVNNFWQWVKSKF